MHQLIGLLTVATTALAQQTPVETQTGTKVHALYAPTPPYPLSVRKQHKGGAGVFVLEMDVETGLVKSVTTKQSTGVPLLDKSCKETFMKWRFPAHKVAPKIIMPIAFHPLDTAS